VVRPDQILSYRPAPGSIPESPGVYRFRDAQGRVVYVGKAKNLRSRLNSYFADLASLHPRTYSMVTTARHVEWTVVSTEVEALQLEYNWIKEFDPRFNVKYRDDKSYPFLAVTLNEDFPRLTVMRGPKRKGVRYFGPYSHAWAIRETLDLLLRVFPARTCSAGVFKRAERVGRPCLLGHIGKCSAPCVAWVSPEQHRQIVNDFCDFMAGHTGAYLKRLEREMRDASNAQEYERAARLRDDAGALRRAIEKQTVVLADDTDADVIALAEDQLEAAVHVFFVRGGRVRGQRGWVVEKVEDVTTEDLVEHFLTQLYGDAQVVEDESTGPTEGVGDVPREVLVPALPSDAATINEWLDVRRGSHADLRVPQRGDKKALMATVARNAAQSLAMHKIRRAGDLTARSQALEEIQESLGLDQAPLRIECFDISNLQGTDIVASMVVFEDGLARKSEYRRFAINSVGAASLPADPFPHAEPADSASELESIAGYGGADRATANDVAAIYEVITRRFRRYLDERAAIDLEAELAGTPSAGPGHSSDDAGRPTLIDPVTGRPRKFAYTPNLVVVDGGPPQVAAAQRALQDLGIDDIALVGLAKRLEEVWRPGDPDPVILPRSSEGLYLLQRVRDEAHRFAISYHRAKRSKSMTRGALDGIPGLGETRRKALLRQFGSVRRLRAASVEEIADVPGVGRRTAELVSAALSAGGGSIAEVGDAPGDSNPPNRQPSASGSVNDHLIARVGADPTSVPERTAG
jgi:excinuclease ABC subunit C